jgi:hypothetical protein
MAEARQAKADAADRDAGAGPFSFQIAPPSAVRRRRALLFTLTGLLVYLLTLIATLPARLLLERGAPPEIWLAASGTVWNGEAALAQGHSIRWAWAPVASLANLAFTTELEVEGAGTDLAGLASWRPGGLVVTNLRGNASATLLSALFPKLPLLCELPMQLEVERIALGGSRPGAHGKVRTSPGSCAPRSGSVGIAVPIPALVGEATIGVGGSTGWVAPRLNRSARLISFTVMPNGGTAFEVSPAGAALFPGAATTRFLPER